ncbi:hypothetical protein DU43_13620 [Methanosarcina mazei]|uniref:Uncharacterized protein n=1 Tax=Methanosarcina mazei TaxID=2209 RepID=A0A0F8HGA2_METMZ|nr:hypothetical protein [Methanosarcina mazei]KKG75751.1 hypothetical protein DU43_13620 [Methanosarcina mazei]
MNKDCPDFGVKNQGNIAFKEIYGKNNHVLLKCKTCKLCFSETRGTAFFGLDTSQEEVLIPVKVTVPSGTAAGRKLFRANVNAETSSITGFDTGYTIIS